MLRMNAETRVLEAFDFGGPRTILAISVEGDRGDDGFVEDWERRSRTVRTRNRGVPASSSSGRRGIGNPTGNGSSTTTTNSANTSSKFPHAKGFHHVIVGTKLETNNAISFITARGCDDHRHIAGAPNLAQDI